MRQTNLCGIAGWHPEWLQKFANVKVFLIIYGLLGTTQGMAFYYFNVTLTTIEKRFKIPSGTTGIILSGNELSQIMLSLILSYVGGQRNRPKWISWGMIFCSMSCFILALPHFIYGPGDDAMRLTQEYLNEYHNSTLVDSPSSQRDKLCLGITITESCDELFSIVPLLLLYLSQFVLGIGQTLYLSLGQPYIDDNTRRTNTPMMLAYAMSLRMCGPVAGYVLGYLTLKLYIDPTKTPLIDTNDPRWLGAWWVGWIFLGIPMLVFSLLVRMFPRRIDRKHINQLDRISEEEPLKHDQLNEDAEMQSDNFPKLKEFLKALAGLLKNKLLMFNIMASVFYILGFIGYTLFLSKYIEVQFNKSPSEATILTGPLTIAGSVTGLLVSGIVIKHYQPGPRKLFLWNFAVGVFIVLCQLSYTFLSCDHSSATILSANLTTKCNMDCYCDNVAYSPVCSVRTGSTFYSPCHAACSQWDSEKKTYSGCGCATQSLEEYENGSAIYKEITFESDAHQVVDVENIMRPGPCLNGCANTFYLFTFIMFAVNWLGSTCKIGNVLLTLRVVAEKDKAFSQGLALMLVSLFALSPGPIMYGYIIDSSCLVWNYRCENRGSCQLYDADQFRYRMNITGISLTFVGVVFDFLVWRRVKNIKLYSEPDEIKCGRDVEK
ncbi:solute carrier organic anion transporter family member 74D-like [Bradysia coprophila]|uniref:solute carrier organic anion transporter family member 74D-like n=1 Tax=Bradysia coprophila TaxID=38358 RepID=UPI00187D8DC7|nr:solute carrier organic anion transporter family member 74D-like [Bradysia coprophila]